ncbi:MAG TPA: hypothetical protein DEP28_09885, partial [Bacteroidetes bacterium]|nr:hypothetical protein [Bacteroidota bacterium]
SFKFRIIKNLILLILFFFTPVLDSVSQTSENVTQFSEYVTDETNTLTQSQLNSLRKNLRSFFDSTSTQIVVYMISTLGDESLEDYSIRLAEKNKIGQKGKDNGVLLLIVKDDRKIRIEVGYGLEGSLTDAESKMIIEKDIKPFFRSGDYYAGINAGVNAIMTATEQEYTTDKSEEKSTGTNIACCFGLPIFVVIIFGFIFISIIGSIIRRIFGFGKSAVFGGKKNKNDWFWFGGSGGSSGSGGFFSGGSSGFGGGGFSGGGGSFGGGGASGSW